MAECLKVSRLACSIFDACQTWCPPPPRFGSVGADRAEVEAAMLASVEFT